MGSKSSYITIRVSPDEREAFKTEAKSNGMTISGYGRQKLLGTSTPVQVLATQFSSLASTVDQRISGLEDQVADARKFIRDE